MTKIFSAHATSADGFITGPNPNPDQPLGRGGSQLFDWYTNGESPSTLFPDFRLSTASRLVFDATAARTGAVIAGRRTYDHSRGWGGRGPHPNAPLFVLSHRPGPPGSDGQSFITAGIEAAIKAATRIAGSKDVALMGSGMIAAALAAGLLDEVTIHQVPVLLGGGVALFGSLPSPVKLAALDVVSAPGVTHLHFAVMR